jgi:hypothetical protein
MRLKIELTGAVFEATLTAEYSPKTVSKVIEALPIESEVMTWGDEIYFEVPVVMDEEHARAAVRKGEIAYWPPGRALCIFYGMTPLSDSADKIIPASAVNLVGRLMEPERLKRLRLREGETIRLSAWA